mmetsp:Transcript_2747/g.4314  ORF Transcript_2747/g.4314 Transcript_2747/m.4314 type:complete len:160 (-) Transcript_2747:1964-2443(-)
MKPGGDRGKQGCYSVEEQEYCDDCGYKFSLGELKKFECKDCGQYLICDYCYEEYYDKINQQTGSALLESSDDSDSEISDEEQKHRHTRGMLEGGPRRGGEHRELKKVKCIYCLSKKNLTDICVKSLKSFGFVPRNGQTKIPVNSLSKDKIKKLSSLRVI